MGFNPLSIVNLDALMDISMGDPEILVGLIDGPILTSHPDLVGTSIQKDLGWHKASCLRNESVACTHGTFIAGMLFARRDSAAPAICPNCTLIPRPIFSEAISGHGVQIPIATSQDLAKAVNECIASGARVVNMSLGLAQLSTSEATELNDVLNRAARTGVIVVAAAGNQATIGSSVITRHPWVIPVVACDMNSRPINVSNLGSSIGRHGISAPGHEITSLGTNGMPMNMMGTSVATPFVTGAVALLWSIFPDATASEIKTALLYSSSKRRSSIVPPLLNAWGAYQCLASHVSPRRTNSHGQY